MRTARALLWEDERSLRLHHFLDVSKRYVSQLILSFRLIDSSSRFRLVNIFNKQSKDLARLKKYLLNYHALCHHTGLCHATITHVPFPPSYTPISGSYNSTIYNSNREVLKKSSIMKLAVSLPWFIGPLLVSLPTHIAHVPAYVLAIVASRTFANEEEEARDRKSVV